MGRTKRTGKRPTYDRWLSREERNFNLEDRQGASPELRRHAELHRTMCNLILSMKRDLRDTYQARFDEIGAERMRLIRTLEGYQHSPRDQLSPDTIANIARWTQEAEVLAERLRNYEADWVAEQMLLHKWHLAHLKQEATFRRVISKYKERQDKPKPGSDHDHDHDHDHAGPDGDGNGAAVA